jgi:NADH-quinone oxidoreductase subunit L
MIQNIALVPLFPLLGFLIAGLGRKQLGNAAGWIASAAVLASFIVSVLIFFEVRAEGFQSIDIHLYDFIKVGKFDIAFEFRVDQLSSLFLLIITGIGFLIHIYSIGYMKGDAGFGKYFAFLNLFIFSMLLLVLGSNFIIMFIGWEGVGLCSYLLIGFWYHKKEYSVAARKAFVMNRIGDLGFLIGMFLIFAKVGTLDFQTLETISFKGVIAEPGYLAAIALCFFVGAMGKSAQIPLFTWLPDAMAGPTPVSALIHAATMVTAGIYMITRAHFIFSFAPSVQTFILIIGLTTALVAATIAIRQNDIKKVLAYSTVSQLGFMFMALGVGAYTTAVFHVLTHAFFKALLFLGSGSVIHAMSNEQDIRLMGGLKKKMPITHITFLIGCLAIAGIPPLSGFFSKDEIMLNLFIHGPYGKVFWVLGMIAALLTAYYMFRLYFITFLGKFRGGDKLESHVHESPGLMTMPLIVLAILSAVGGFLGIPEVLHGNHWLHHFLSPIVEKSMSLNPLIHSLGHTEEYIMMAVAIAVAVIGILLAWTTYKKYDAKKENKGIEKFFEDKWYWDEAYENAIQKPFMKLNAFAEKNIERKGIDGGVNGIGKLVHFASDKLRLLQNGSVGVYLFLMVLGMIILFIIQLVSNG